MAMRKISNDGTESYFDGGLLELIGTRILAPRDPQDISFGAKLSLNDMQKIENAIKNLFIQNF